MRRKFDQALKAQPNHKKRKTSLAQQALQRIQLLYKIERAIKDKTPEEKQAIREEKALPILKGLREWLDQHLPVVVKQSAIGKAMHYMKNQWPRLTVYTQDLNSLLTTNEHGLMSFYSYFSARLGVIATR